MKKKNIFIEDIHLETRTLFRANGEIDIFPCEFEQDQQILEHGSRVYQRGRMITGENGASYFKPYQTGGLSQFQILWKNPYTTLKMSSGRLILTVSVPLEIEHPLEEMSLWASNILMGAVPPDVEDAIAEQRRDWIRRHR